LSNNLLGHPKRRLVCRVAMAAPGRAAIGEGTGVHSWFYKAVICRRGPTSEKPMFSTFLTA
jgi:hypothetical protein